MLRNSGYNNGFYGMGPTAAAITISGDNIFVVRGNMVYQLRASDLSLIGQKTLPSLGMGGSMNGTGMNAPGTSGNLGTGGPASTGTTTDPNANSGTTGTDSNGAGH